MQGTKTRLLTGNKAMAEAIKLEMERDPNVFVMGEDVGVYGESSDRQKDYFNNLDQIE